MDAFHVCKQAVFGDPCVIAIQWYGDSQPLAEAKNDGGESKHQTPIKAIRLDVPA